MRFRRMLKLLAVDASMLFLAFTVKQIVSAEEIRQIRPEPQVVSYELNLPEYTPGAHGTTERRTGGRTGDRNRSGLINPGRTKDSFAGCHGGS